MRKLRLKTIVPLFIIGATVFTACKDDSERLLKPKINASFVEEFDTISNAKNRGWKFINRSTPIGIGTWKAGGDYFASYSGNTNTSHIECDYNSCAGTTPQGNGFTSNWLVSPVVQEVKNGDKITFFTTSDNQDYIDRLQVRISSLGESLTVGSGDDPGDFDLTLLDINPNYDDASGLSPYPAGWTKFTATVYGLPRPVKTRFAFRYFMEGGGPGGLELGSAVGIDSVAFVSKMD